MSTIEEQPAVEDVMAFAMQVGEDLAAASSTAMAVLGDRLGLYRDLAGAGAVTAAELAARSGCAERYVREWLASQVAGGWVLYDADSKRFTLPPAHAAVLAHESSPAFLLGSAQVTAALFAGLDRLGDAFRTGEGIAWGDHHRDLHEGVERFFRAACEAQLPLWIGELGEVAGRLASGGTIVDLGCGRGAAALAIARAFPAARVTGVDTHDESIEHARRAAGSAGLGDRVSFLVQNAGAFDGYDADLVCMLDCLHDMGDPVAAVRQARTALGENGVLLIVEPMAADRLEDNVGWVARGYYATSTAFCTPCALAQEGGWALGNQAGEQRLRNVLARGGMTEVEHLAATPFQLVLQARAG
jgi:SAM-dependent methyltransferase